MPAIYPQSEIAWILRYAQNDDFGKCWNQRKPIQGASPEAQSSDLHDFGFFLLAHFVHALDLFIGQLLNLFQRALLLGHGDLLVLGCLLDPIISVAADVAHRRLVLFEHFVQVLDHVAATFFRHWRHRNA